MTIISFQSSVSFGYVGNSAAVFALQRLGFEVWPVPTVQFSNHTGYGDWGGAATRPDVVADLVRGLDARGAFTAADAIVSGYLGAPATAAAVFDAVAAARAERPDLAFCCDPVIGDRGRGIFVKPDLPALFRDRGLGLATILTPNHFELEILTGMAVGTVAEAVTAARALIARGPCLVLVTSLVTQDQAPQRIAMLAVTPDAAFLHEDPVLPIQPNGAGDLTAALFLAHGLRGLTPDRALLATAAGVRAVLAETVRLGRGELALIHAQDRLAETTGPMAAGAVRQVA